MEFVSTKTNLKEKEMPDFEGLHIDVDTVDTTTDLTYLDYLSR